MMGIFTHAQERPCCSFTFKREYKNSFQNRNRVQPERAQRSTITHPHPLLTRHRPSVCFTQRACASLLFRSCREPSAGSTAQLPRPRSVSLTAARPHPGLTQGCSDQAAKHRPRQGPAPHRHSSEGLPDARPTLREGAGAEKPDPGGGTPPVLPTREAQTAVGG